MKNLIKLTTLLMMMLVCVGFSACSDDDDEYNDVTTAAIEGTYTGTLKVMGYTDDPARCYVTLTRKSSDALSVEVLCETFGLDVNPVILRTETNDDGSVTLSSESGYTINGTYKAGTLTLSFGIGDYTYYFIGSRS